MFENTKISEWMTQKVLITSPDTPISAAHQLMRQNEVRRLPVVKNGKLLGIISLGDVREASPSDATTLSIWELNYLWSQLTVSKVMSQNVITIKPDASMLDAAELMLEHKISGLPVVDTKGTVVGIITESDIFRMLVRNRMPKVNL